MLPMQNYILPILFACLAVSCNTSEKLFTATNHVEISKNKEMSNSVEASAVCDYQPSGSVEYINNDLKSEIYLAEANIFDSITEYVVMHTGSENYSVKVDTVITKNVAPTELKEANQSFTLGMISFIALIGWILSSYYMLAFFAIAFNLIAIVFGIAGLRKGIIANRILRKSKNIYTNANKADWGIALSVPIFAVLLAIAIFLIYLISTGNFWLS